MQITGSSRPSTKPRVCQVTHQFLALVRALVLHVAAEIKSNFTECYTAVRATFASVRVRIPTVALASNTAYALPRIRVPDTGAEYCDECVCLSVCLCVCVCVCVFVCPRSYLRNYTSDLHQFFLYALPTAVARSASGGVVIRYVLPVSWMTSYLLKSQGCSTLPAS